MWRNGTEKYLGPRGPRFVTRLSQLVLPLGKEINRHFQVAQSAGNAQWAEPSPLFTRRSRTSPLNYENEYLVLALVGETAVQAVAISIVWAFHSLKIPESGDEPRGYALHRVAQFSFIESSITCVVDATDAISTRVQHVVPRFAPRQTQLHVLDAVHRLHGSR